MGKMFVSDQWGKGHFDNCVTGKRQPEAVFKLLKPRKGKSVKILVYGWEVVMTDSTISGGDYLIFDGGHGRRTTIWLTDKKILSLDQRNKKHQRNSSQSSKVKEDFYKRSHRGGKNAWERLTVWVVILGSINIYCKQKQNKFNPSRKKLEEEVGEVGRKWELRRWE